MIAIVDDDIEIVSALSLWVKMLGLESTLHYSAESLVDWINNLPSLDHTPFSAVILDINLPGMNGVELGRQLRVWFPELVIVMVTALRYDDINSLGKLPTAAHLLRKPYDLEELEAILLSVA